MAECSWWEVGCNVDNWVNSTAGKAIENVANAVVEAFGKVITSLGTVWVHIGTPNLTGSGGGSAIKAGSAAPDSANVTLVLGYVMWISLGIAVLALLILGGHIATRMRTGEGFVSVGRVGLVLFAVVLISAAGAIVAGLMPSGPRNVDGAALFLQSGLWWYMGAAAVMSVIIGGARMAWEQRAEPGRETVKSLLTLVVVAGAGVTIIGLLVAAADSFSVWIINGSLSCDVTTDSACFGKNMLRLIDLTTNSPAGGLGALLIIILGLFAVFTAGFQIMLMVARGGMLVILAGILPMSASFTNTEMGKSWFKKCVGWLVAFVLYKPAAAIVYAAAFQLVGTDVFSDDGTGLLAILTGLTLMVIALFAMPALLRFVTPMVGAMAGTGGALAVGAAAALPSGAAALGRLAAGSGSGSSNSAAPPAPSGSDGEVGSQGSPGPSGGGETGGGNAPQHAQQTENTGGGNEAGNASGSAAPSPSAAAASAGGGETAAAGAGAGGGAAANGAAAGGSAAAAGTAAGPVGIAAGAALEAGEKVAGAAQSLGEQSTGEGGGPDGSR